MMAQFLEPLMLRAWLRRSNSKSLQIEYLGRSSLMNKSAVKISMACPFKRGMTCSSGDHDGPVPGAVNVASAAEKDQIQKAFIQNNLGGANQL
jgi:hypothetical protein